MRVGCCWVGKGRTAGDEQTGRQEELGEQSCPAKEGELHPDGARIPQRVLSRGVTGFTCTLDGSAQPMLPRRHFSDWRFTNFMCHEVGVKVPGLQPRVPTGISLYLGEYYTCPFLPQADATG